MKRLVFCTSNNTRYKMMLDINNFPVSEFGFPISIDALEEIRNINTPCISLIDTFTDISETTEDAYRLLSDKGLVFCMSDSIPQEIKQFLLDHGISDVLSQNSLKYFNTIIKIISDGSGDNAGTVIVLDDDLSIRKVLNNIITRFKYNPVFISTVDELFTMNINFNVRFILVNLGTDRLDLNGLVRKFYSYKESKHIPVLVYKDMRDGLFVHEFVSGLNRLTRFILGTDELYSLLIDIFFKKEIIPLLSSLGTSADYSQNECYNRETVNQIFFLNEKNIFNKKNILDDASIGEMMRLSHAIQKSLINVESLKWLRIESCNKSVSIAEKGV